MRVVGVVRSMTAAWIHGSGHGWAAAGCCAASQRLASPLPGAKPLGLGQVTQVCCTRRPPFRTLTAAPSSPARVGKQPDPACSRQRCEAPACPASMESPVDDARHGELSRPPPPPPPSTTACAWWALSGLAGAADELVGMCVGQAPAHPPFARVTRLDSSSFHRCPHFRGGGRPKP